MGSLFWLVIGLSLAGGITYLVVFAVIAPVKNRLIKSWQFYLLLIVLLRFIVPVPLSLPQWLVSVKPVTDFISAAVTEQDSRRLSSDYFTATPSAHVQRSNTQTAYSNQRLETAPSVTVNHVNFMRLLPFIWLAGSAGLFLWSAVGYVLTVRRLKCGRIDLIPGRVPVYESSLVTVPIAAGLFRPAIYLPKDYSFGNYAVRHEFCHLRRGDIWLKWLIQLVVCIHWFNPLVYLLKRELNRLIELSCDRAALRGLSQSERRAYGIMLLDTARTVNTKGGMLIASHGKDKRLLQERLKEIMKNKKATRKAAAAMSVLAAVVLCASILSGALLAGCTASAAPSANTADKTNGTTDIPFVNDPDALGTWEYVGTVKNISDFDPAKASKPASSFEVVFAPDGKINQPACTWTKGVVQSDSTNETDKYEIKEIDGSKYMFFSLFIDDTLIKTAVLKWSTSSTAFDMTVDNVDLPFNDDPAVIGTWKSVDYIASNSSFDPTKKSFGSDLPLTGMTFQSGGGVVRFWSDGTGINWSGFTWTKGIILDRYMMTASKYEIKEIDGTAYLFYYWKNGDYNYRHTINGYFVLVKS
jgi:beta-lactamase regulating signal transducer with metallopeptidase domain